VARIAETRERWRPESRLLREKDMMVGMRLRGSRVVIAVATTL